jgi:glycosyltransferase involved in cell wall biosynthesis
MKKKVKKILFILKIPPPIHGSTVMNLKVQNSHIIKNNFSCQYIGISLSKNLDEIGKNYFRKAIKLFGFFGSVFRALLFNRPHLVYFAISPTGFAFLKDFFLILLIKMRQVPIVFHIHGKGMGQFSQRNWLWKLIYEWTFKGECVICLSTYLVSDIRPFYKNKPYILPNGIDESTLIKGVVYQDRDIPVILYLSNLMKTKGVLDLVDASSLIFKKGIRFEVAIVGGPADISFDYLSEYVSNKGISGVVKIYGPLFGQEKLQMLSNSDILVLPTYYGKECFPVVILEAMQYKMPVISTYEGAIPDIVENGISGFLVNQRDVLALAEKMEILLSDRILRSSMGMAGHKRYEEMFTLQKFENRLNDILTDILNKNGCKNMGNY